MSNEMSASVLINGQEARSGVILTLPLPDGRTTSVTIPAGVYNGQVLRFPEHVPSVREGEPPDTLVLTVQIAGQDEQTVVNAVPSFPVDQAPSAVASSPVGYQAPSAATPPFPGYASAATPVDGQAPPAAMPPFAGYPPASAPQAFPAPGTYPISQPPTRNRHIVRNIVIIVCVLLVLLISGVGLLAFSVKQQIDQHVHATATQVAVHGTQVAQTQQAVVNATATEQGRQQEATQVVQTAVAGVATATVANPNPYLFGLGIFLVQDKMDGSDTPNPWGTGPDCSYQGGALHVVSPSADQSGTCDLIDSPSIDGSRSHYPQFKNFTVEFKMTIIKGDTGGIDFRVGSRQGYSLLFDSKGNSQLLSFQGNTQKVLSSDSSPDFHQGLNQENTIGLVVEENSIIWFVNGQPGGTFKDTSTSDKGSISLEASSYANSSYTTEAAFHDFKLWTLDL